MNKEFTKEVEKRKQEAEESLTQFDDFCKEVTRDLTILYNKIEHELLEVNPLIKDVTTQQARMEYLIRLQERIQEAKEMMDVCIKS